MTQQLPAAPSTSRYRPELDALRAVAIIPVVLFHLNSELLPGGYLGVDVFFVLSGYLITGILLRDLDVGRLSLRTFYARRVRRLGPVLVAVVAFTLILATLFLPDGGRVYAARQCVAALLSLSNFFVLFSTGDYWGPAAEQTALLHTWSLSVEEQFYLIFPVLLFLVHRFFRGGVIPFLVTLIVFSLAAWVIVGAASPPTAFYLLPTRAWELAGGGLLAAIHQRSAASRQEPPASLEIRRSSAGRTLCCWSGVLMVIIAYGLPSAPRANEWNVILAVVGTCLFLADPGRNGCYRALAQRPLIGLGKVSYSWYMWHWPLIVFNDLTGLYAGPWGVGLAGLAISIVSWRWIEQTTRHRSGIVPKILLAFAVVLVASVYSIQPRRTAQVDRDLFKESRWYGSYYNAYPAGEQSQWYEAVIAGVDVPQRENASADLISSGIEFGDSNPEVVLMGDSHATMWAHLVHHLVSARGRSLNVWAINGMDPLFRESGDLSGLPETKLRYDAERRAKLAQWRPRLTILSMRWWYRDPERIRPFLRYVASVSDQVILIGATPELRIGDENAVSYMAETGVVPRDGRTVYLPAVQNAAFVERSEQIRGWAGEISNVSYLDVGPRYQLRGDALALVDRYSVYLDDDHLTDFGTFLSKNEVALAIDRGLIEAVSFPGSEKPTPQLSD